MRYSIFGESHGSAIGVVLEQVPPGLVLDREAISKEMARRAPGKSPLSTARKEADVPEILSGVFDGKTTGTPLCAIIHNSDHHSKDYAKTRFLARPSHGDYTGFVRYQGCNDYRGGGHFSGRLTAPLVFAGAVAKQLLAQRGITVGAHISQIGTVKDKSFADTQLTPTLFQTLSEKAFPTVDDQAGAAMQAEILQAREELDSIGGAIQCAVLGLPVGVGSPDLGCRRSTCSPYPLSRGFPLVPALPSPPCGAARPTTPSTWTAARSRPAPTTAAASTAASATGCPSCSRWPSGLRRPLDRNRTPSTSPPWRTLS